MLKKKGLNNVLVIFTGIIILIGVLQTLLFIPGQVEIMKNAASQGIASQQIWKYFWQQFVPQILTYIMFTIGFVFTILSIRRIGMNLNDLISVKRNIEGKTLGMVEIQEDERDDFLEEFEIVSNKNDN